MLTKQIVHSKKESGQGLVEYSLILVLVAISVVIALALFGESISDTYCNIVKSMAVLNGSSGDCVSSSVSPQLIDEGPDYLNLEAKIDDPAADPDNPFGRVKRVEFYIDTLGESPVQTEFHHRYCLSGNPGGEPCHNYNTSGLPSGNNLITIKVHFIDGSSSSSTYNYNK